METNNGCTCGPSEDTASPVLDVRLLPHEVRHAAIFGILDATAAGASLVLIAPHEPLPLLSQLEQRHPGAFTVHYEHRGPDAWRLRLTREL
jgi:uncharacterized protein (DUF2249 family)